MRKEKGGEQTKVFYLKRCIPFRRGTERCEGLGEQIFIICEKETDRK